jgi:dephospho-CoA kinase
MLVIALTGGIGSGKSTVSEIFKSKNIPIIDTDIIAKQIVEKDKPAYNEIIKLFGEEILNEDKNINRKVLRKLVFSSKEKRLQLEKSLHPLIWNEVKYQITLMTSDSSISPPYCIVVVPLLLENLTQDKPVDFDRILIVDIEEELQIKRAKKRDECTGSEIKDIMKNQVSRQTRINAADDIIENTEDLDSLNEKVKHLHKKYYELAKNISK